MKTEEFRELCTKEGFDADQVREFELAISHGLNIKLLVNLACDAKCMHEIILGMLHHVDVNLYANKMFDWESMRYIRLGMEAKFDMVPYANGEYDAQQLECIYNSYLHNLNISLIANSDYDTEKMYQCYVALKNYPKAFKSWSAKDFDSFNALQLYQLTEVARLNLPLDPVANTEYNDMQMQQICLGLHSGVCIDEYNNASLSANQMNQIRIGLEHGVDVKVYSDIKFDAFQMKQLRLGLEQNLDVSMYCDKEFSGKVMSLIRFGMLEGIEVSEYATPGITEEAATAIYNRLMDLQTSITGDDTSDYEIGEAYLDLLGWGSGESDRELSDQLASGDHVIGIANPNFVESMISTVDASTSLGNNEKADERLSGTVSSDSQEDSKEVKGHVETEIPVDFSGSAQVRETSAIELDLGGLQDKIHTGKAKKSGNAAPSKVNI